MASEPRESWVESVRRERRGRQLALDGAAPATAQANRGTGFERMIERAHHFYRTRKVAVVERNKRVWDYTSAARARQLPKFMAARTLDDRHFLVMETSLVDYSGTARGRSIRFDAKETMRASIPLDNFKRGQVEELCEHASAGALAGFLVHFGLSGEVFWVEAIDVRDAQDLVLFQRGKGKHPKSLPLAWMREHALHVYTVRGVGDVCDYLPKLLESKGVSEGHTDKPKVTGPPRG